MLNKDTWISEILSREVYCFEPGEDAFEKYKDRSSEACIELNRALSRSPVLIYCKVPTVELALAHSLEELGFHLVDTNLTFEKKTSKSYNIPLDRSIRLAVSSDRDDVVRVAEENFMYSRFHLDPLIHGELANKLKGGWVRNHFFGLRGDDLVVKLIGNRVCGFLQLLRKPGESLTIDLIAVDKKHHRENIASQLIAFAETKFPDCHLVRVGTQVANIPSIRLYEKLQFRLVASQYIFHYHN